MGRFQPGFASAKGEFLLFGSGSGSGGDTTIVIPAGNGPHDFVIAWNVAFGYASPPTAPSWTGFTALANQTQSTTRLYVAGKLLSSAESTLTGMAGFAGADAWIIVVYRPRQAYASFANNSANAEGTSGNPSAQTISASGEGNLPILAYGGTYSADGITGQTISPSMNELSSTAALNAHHLPYLSSDTPANISYDTGDGGSVNILVSGYVDFSI